LRSPDTSEPGDRQRFEQMILPHLDAAYNLARWLVRDAAIAQDVTQDAMLRALTYFSGFRGGDARAWLLQIVRNAAYGRLAARPELPLEADTPELIDPADDPEASYARGQDAGRLDRALAALPAELRECLVLRELEELSYKEIARIVDVPIGTVMSRLWRARQALLQAQGGPRCGTDRQ